MTTGASYATFDTAIGTGAIAWSKSGIVGVHLPETTDAAVRARVLRRFQYAAEQQPPPDAAHAIKQIRALMRGEPADFSNVVLDLDGLTELQRAVYDITRTIAPGRTMTYGEIANRIGTRDAREVGRALGDNPFPIIVPCHRVVAADGRMHGFSGSGGVRTKLKLLEIEGYEVVPGPSLFD